MLLRFGPVSNVDNHPGASTLRLIQDLTDAALGRPSAPVTLSAGAYRVAAAPHLNALLANAAVNEVPAPAGRGVALKKLILKLTGFSWTRQRASNQAVLGLVEVFLREFENMNAIIEHERRNAASAMSAMESIQVASAAGGRQVAEQMAQRMVVVSDEVSRLQVVVERLDVHDTYDEVSRLREVVERLDVHDTSALDSLYQRLEEHFRPGNTSLRDRFLAYLPDVESLRGGSFPLLDIGTGRGDFLQILTEAGIPCIGVDLNPFAVQAALANGFNVHLGDATSYLLGIQAQSIGAISAFHVVEHMQPNDLILMIDACQRALKPGGVLILETPNPTNLVVGASTFYNDPTHVRPISPDYLSFLVRDRGFVDVATRFLHPTAEYDLSLSTPNGPEFESLRHILADVQWALKGPLDFAVVARCSPESA